MPGGVDPGVRRLVGGSFDVQADLSSFQLFELFIGVDLPNPEELAEDHRQGDHPERCQCSQLSECKVRPCFQCKRGHEECDREPDTSCCSQDQKDPLVDSERVPQEPGSKRSEDEHPEDLADSETTEDCS